MSRAWYDVWVPGIKTFFADSKGNIVLWQMPNAPLIAWFALLLLAKMLPAGGWRLWAGYASTASLVLWALLEVGWGVSYFRRTLGIAVLVLIGINRFW